MKDYEIQAKTFIKQFSPQTQRKAAVAVEDVLKLGRDWEWIDTALRKKGLENWEQWGFGLMFNANFNGSVLQQIERNREAESVNLQEFYECLDGENNLL